MQATSLMNIMRGSETGDVEGAVQKHPSEEVKL